MIEKYSYEIKLELMNVLEKLAKKNKKLFNAVMKKIFQLTESPYLGKPLKYGLKGMRRSHIGHFVLMYEIKEKEHIVVFVKFAHHDDAYR